MRVGHDRQADLGGGSPAAFHGGLAHLQVAVNVLDHDDGVIDQDADGSDKPSMVITLRVKPMA